MSFDWKDYADHRRTKLLTLDAIEFLRRFLMHVLPAGLVGIRQFGFLAHRVRKQKLQLCRALLAPASSDADVEDRAPADDPPRCPLCQPGRLWVVEILRAELLSIPDTS